MSKRLKSKKSPETKIKVNLQPEIQIDYPIFCFRYLELSYKKDDNFYYKFVERLVKLSDLSWVQINGAPRHGFGTEKMPLHKIKPCLPKFVSPDVKYLTVFRANGDNRPFLGLRIGNIFHIIFVEEKFNDIYDHK